MTTKRSRKRQQVQPPLEDTTVVSFSFSDVVKFTDATRSNLIHWTNVGIIKPDIEETAGPGHPRCFSAMNLLEAQLAAMVNRFRVPVVVVAQAVRALRDHHEMCAAVWSANELTDGRETLTANERAAVKRSQVEAFLRRDRIAGAEGVKPAKFYQRAVDRDADLFSAENQRLILHHAGAWREFLRSPFNYGNFYGLFVYPEDGSAIVADEPLNLREVIEFEAIVVNLAPAADYIRAVAGL